MTDYWTEIWEPMTRDLYARGGWITLIEARGPGPGAGYRAIKRLTLEEAIAHKGACAIYFGDPGSVVREPETV